MKNVNKYFLGILVFCLISGIFLLLSVFSLQDIHAGNSGLTSDWTMVKMSYVINGLLYLFIVMTFLKFRRTLKKSH